MTNCKDSISITSILPEGTEYGIFFRNPIQKVYKDNFLGECYNWKKTAIFKLIPFLLNVKLWFKCTKWFKIDSLDDLAGFNVKELCFPIYFKREVRRAFHKLTNHPTIKEIKVYGWEPYKNHCGGAAEKEIATFFFHDGSKQTFVSTEGSFHYAYKHIIEDMIKKDLVFI